MNDGCCVYMYILYIQYKKTFCFERKMHLSIFNNSVSGSNKMLLFKLNVALWI